MTDFTNPLYGAFLLLLVPTYWLLSRRAQNLLLLVASAIFYAGWDWRFLCLLLFSTVVDYCCARVISNTDSQRRRKTFLMLSIAINVGALCYFKYSNFFYDSAITALRHLGIQGLGGYSLKILLPVGISFYTFQSLGYIIDVYRGEIKSEKHWVDFAVFVMFFPHMVAGPIMRAKRLLTQFQNDRVFDFEMAIRGVLLIFWGLFKKLVIANSLALYSDAVFGRKTLATLPSGEAFVAILAFSLQIYTDFSAYSDMAIGSARLLGFELMVNFDRPYTSTSINEFWSRWHISLSTWMRDYIYIPLGGNRCSRLRRNMNVLVTFLISGLWHGANWTFVAWGGYHGVICSAEDHISSRTKQYKNHFGPTSQLVLSGVRWITVMALVCFGWSLFRAPSFHFFGELWKCIFRFNGVGSAGLMSSYLFVYFGILLCSYLIQYFAQSNRISRLVTHLGLLILPPFLATATWLFAANLKPPFIYFQF